ncbi:tetratricopeptide repeat protein [Candidatus Magnetomonas plexicatena]|uniref:tetratricopeptide repeat protein n=1 Tax=Candidatus Magnetomonas plexicatena TaxID=2552947 RepID=UPI001102DF5B|nr:tetratricopeptide repeat protein [Nitrospirales bacterium LBB_01]
MKRIICVLCLVPLFLLFSCHTADTGPKTAIDYVKRGNAFKKGDINMAIADYTKAIETDPKSGIAYYTRATAYEEIGDYKRAVADYSKAIGINPKNPLGYYKRCNLYEKIGDYDNTTKGYTKLLEMDPKDVLAYYKRGALYDTMGKYDNAVTDYTKAIEISPRYPQAYILRGTAYMKNGDYDKAFADFNKVIELDPKHPDVYTVRAELYSKKGDYDRAFPDYNKAVSGYVELHDTPKLIKLYSTRGFLYEQKGYYDKAIADYSNAIDINQQDAEMYYKRANLYLKTGEDANALADLNSVIDISPMTYVSAYIYLGDLYKKKGNLDKAIANYIEAARLGDKNSQRYLDDNGYKWNVVLPKGSSDTIMFLGNSVTTQGNWAMHFPGNNVIIAKLVLWEKNIENDLAFLVNNTKNNAESRPTKIFIMTGIAILRAGVETRVFINEYMKALSILSSNLPDTKIYVQSVLPVILKDPAENTIVNRKIIEANRELKIVVSKLNNANIQYVDLYKGFVEHEGEHLKSEYAVEDGIHLNRSGYDLWESLIKDYVYSSQRRY